MCVSYFLMLNNLMKHNTLWKNADAFRTHLTKNWKSLCWTTFFQGIPAYRHLLAAPQAASILWTEFLANTTSQLSLSSLILASITGLSEPHNVHDVLAEHNVQPTISALSQQSLSNFLSQAIHYQLVAIPLLTSPASHSQLISIWTTYYVQ